MWCRQPLCIFRTARKSCDSDPVVINRYISVEAPPAWSVSAVSSPRTVQRRFPTPEHVSSIIGVLTAKPSRKRRKNRTEPYRIIDTFQKQLNETQTSLDLLPQYDTDISARGKQPVEQGSSHHQYHIPGRTARMLYHTELSGRGTCGRKNATIGCTNNGAYIYFKPPE